VTVTTAGILPAKIPVAVSEPCSVIIGVVIARVFVGTSIDVAVVEAKFISVFVVIGVEVIEG